MIEDYKKFYNEKRKAQAQKDFEALYPIANEIYKAAEHIADPVGVYFSTAHVSEIAHWTKEENYWDKLTRIAASPYNRIQATHHISRHHTIYVLGLTAPNNILFHPITAKTLSIMEFA